MKRFSVFILVLLASGVFMASCSDTNEDEKFMFYMHGRIIEEEGVDAVSEKFGKYEYRKIIDEFEKNGFTIKSKRRFKGTDPDDYAERVKKDISKLLKAGVKPESITVVGASKGSLIAMLASTKLKNKKINFVFMAACNDQVKESYSIDLHGRVLSIYEASDTLGGNSCKAISDSSTGLSEYKEIKLNTGADHGFIYKPMKEWFEPTVAWANKIN